MTTPAELLQWLLAHARDSEWATQHAGEDRYCPYCNEAWINANRRSVWESQDAHHPDCQYVAMMREAESLLATPPAVLLTQAEAEAVFEWLDQLTGSSPENVLAWNGSDDPNDPATAAAVKIFRAVKRPVPEGL